MKATKVELEKEIAAKNLIRANKRDASPGSLSSDSSPGSLSSDSTKEGWSDSDRRDALPHNTRNSEPQVSKKLRTSPPRKPREWSAIKMSPSPQSRFIWHPAGTEIVDPDAATTSPLREPLLPQCEAVLAVPGVCSAPPLCRQLGRHCNRCPLAGLPYNENDQEAGMQQRCNLCKIECEYPSNSRPHPSPDGPELCGRPCLREKDHEGNHVCQIYEGDHYECDRIDSKTSRISNGDYGKDILFGSWKLFYSF